MANRFLKKTGPGEWKNSPVATPAVESSVSFSVENNDTDEDKSLVDEDPVRDESVQTTPRKRGRKPKSETVPDNVPAYTTVKVSYDVYERLSMLKLRYRMKFHKKGLSYSELLYVLALEFANLHGISLE